MQNKDCSLLTVYRSLLLHFIAKDAFDYFGISACPAAEHLDGERDFDFGKLGVCVVIRLVGYRAKMIFDKSLLRLVAPEISEKALHDGALVVGHVAVDDDCRVFAENG